MHGLCVGFPLLPAPVSAFPVSIWHSGTVVFSHDEALQNDSCQAWADGRWEPTSKRIFSLGLQETNIFTDVFGRNASACFELRAFCTVHYISAMQNTGCFPLGKYSSGGVLMSPVLTSRVVLSTGLLEAKWLSSASSTCCSKWFNSLMSGYHPLDCICQPGWYLPVSCFNRLLCIDIAFLCKSL